MLAIFVEINSVQHSIVRIEYTQGKTKVTLQNENTGERTTKEYNGILPISEIVLNLYN